MGEVSQGEGRTVLFVSHNMAAVKSLCKTGIVLQHGLTEFTGPIDYAVAEYLKNGVRSQNNITFTNEYDNDYFTLHQISLNPINQTSDIPLNENHEIEIHTYFTLKKNPDDYHFTYVLSNDSGDALFTFSHNTNKLKLKVGFNKLTCHLPKGFLNIGTYYLSPYLIEDSKTTVFTEKDILSFDVQESQREIGTWMGKEPGFIKPIFNWTIA
jgi:lipopolysaccharide transport system ATP-binding protein